MPSAALREIYDNPIICWQCCEEECNEEGDTYVDDDGIVHTLTRAANGELMFINFFPSFHDSNLSSFNLETVEIDRDGFGLLLTLLYCANDIGLMDGCHEIKMKDLQNHFKDKPLYIGARGHLYIRTSLEGLLSFAWVFPGFDSSYVVYDVNDHDSIFTWLHFVLSQVSAREKLKERMEEE